ncbi:MATE family efflux transporter [bacterium 1XD42-1]|nr:MATE family efflux transporter [bacterium 1XD42-8]RKJ63725.1 MATE family efflux transporter [bacterium 1XD42-1]
MKLFVKDKEFYKMLLMIAIPIALQNLVTVMVSMMDTLMIGQLGEIQLSATSIANQLWFMLMICCFGIAGGANVLLAQYWGKGDLPVMRRIQAITFKVTFAISLLFVLVSQAFPQQFMGIFTPDPETIALGASYLRIVGWSYPLYALANAAIMMLRSVGTVNISVIVYLVSLIVNTCVNYVLIFGHFGAPRMEIRGAAVGTALSRCFEFGITMVFLLSKEKKIRFSLKDLLPNNRDLYRKYIAQSVPVIGNEAMWGIGASMVAVVIGRMGTNFVAANSIYTVLNQLVTVLIFGVGNAALTIVGNTIGTGNYELAKQRALTLYILGAGIGILAGGLTLGLGPVLIRFYQNLTPETVEILEKIILVGAVIVFFQALAVVGMVGVLRAGGDSRFVFICEASFLWGVAVPLGFLTGLVLGWPAPVVFFILKSDEVLKTMVSTVRILRFRWLRDITVS